MEHRMGAYACTPVPEPIKSRADLAMQWPEFMSGAAQQKYLSAEHGIRAAAQGGYSHWYIDGSLEGERPADFTLTRIAGIRQLMAELRVEPILHGNFKVPLGSDVRELREAAVQYIRAEIDLCDALGGAPLIVHGGGIVEPRLVQEARRRGLEGLIDGLRGIVRYAADRGVSLWLENLSNYTKFHPFYYVYTSPDEYERVLDAVPGVSFFLDVSHSHVNDGDPVAVFDRFHARVVAMSFSDNEGVRDSHMPLGRGNLDYRGLLYNVLRHKWRGLIGFETRGSGLTHSVEFLNRLTSEISGEAPWQ